MTQDDDPKRVDEILDRLEQAGDQGDSVTVGEMTERIGERSHGPFLLIPALIDISPLGAIPGVPTVLAVIILLFSAQVAFGREHLWLPGFISARSVSSKRLHRSVERLRPIARWMDKHFHGRLAMFTTEPFVRAAGIACVALAFIMPPLEIVPFATTIATAPIAVFGLALFFRDGLLMTLGFLLTVGAAAGFVWFIMG